MRHTPLIIVVAVIAAVISTSNAKEKTLEPTITKRKGFTLIGIQTWIDPETADHEAIFDNQYRPHEEALRKMATSPGFYGAYFSARGPGEVGYMVGVETPEGTSPPKGLKALAIPASQYAVFEFPRADIGKTWGYIHGEWLPNSPHYTLASSPVFEYYSKSNTDETRLAIWIPIKPKEKAEMTNDTGEERAIYAQRVVLQGAPRPFGSCSSLATLAAALQQRGEEITYTYLMGASSRAFRLQFSWCPSAPHAYIGFNCFEPALKAVRYEATTLSGSFTFEEGKDARPSTKAEREHTLQAVKAAIDVGQSVIFGSEEDALLVGYEPIGDDNPTGWLQRPGPLGGPPREDEPYVKPIRNLPWGLTTLKKAGNPMPRREAATWAIRTAVDNAERGTVENRPLKTGFAAWDKWIAELEPAPFQSVLEETRRELTEKGRGSEDPLWGICLGNAWTYENLYFARLEAARYLRDIAPDMPEAARPHLLKAADAYNEVHDALVPAGDCFTKIAPYPFRMKKVDDEWTDTMRQRQAKLLQGALPHERTAVNELKAALAELE